MSQPADPPQLREPDLPRTAKDRDRALRTGWTTGTCAAAAAKAATAALVSGRTQHAVEIALPSGERVEFPVERCELLSGRRAGRAAEAVVVKDAGDDPDVTHGAHLTATVSWREGAGVAIDGGVGVGVVTKPGLGHEVGSAAINDTPRRMISYSVAEAVGGAADAASGTADTATGGAAEAAADVPGRGLQVIISVPDGELRARKTTNARLGILGGISVLGTTGVVRPFSTASWRASVVQAIQVMSAQGERTLVLCTGGRTEAGARRLLPDLPEVCFVEVGDFTGAALRQAVEGGITDVVFVGMAGKLTKLAAGVLMTHYTRSKVRTGLLGEITRAVGRPTAHAAEPGEESAGRALEEVAAEVDQANTARHAHELWERHGILRAAGDELCRRVRDVLTAFSEERVGADVAMVDFSGARCVAATRPEWVA